MDKEVKIQAINKNDSEEIRRLFEVYKKSILEDYPEYSRLTKEYLVREDKINELIKNAGIILGAFIEGKLVGYLIARKVWGGVGYCEALGVLNEHQRKGIGAKLVKEYERLSLLEGAHSLQLESDIKNLEFHKKQGYNVLCLDKKGYFGTDNYVMKKVLQEPKEENFLR
jgi:GNAT superfamily N-acetyltransferase